jgi:hypothetical protein
MQVQADSLLKEKDQIISVLKEHSAGKGSG